jgi:hypothetical protein
MSRLQIVGDKLLDQYALNIPGVDQYAFVDNPSFKSNTQGAFLFRYRPTSGFSSNGVRGVIGYGVKSAGNDSLFQIVTRRNSSTAINATYRNQMIPDAVSRSSHGGSIATGYGVHIFSVSTWCSWICQSNGSAYKHYINGVDVGATAWIAGGTNNGDWFGDISGTDHRMTVGSQFTSNAPLAYSDHRHNEMIYVNRPLTAGEATLWHNGGVTSNPHRLSFRADIVSWWRMGDSRDDATTIYDEIGSNHLTLVNMNASNYVTP